MQLKPKRANWWEAYIGHYELLWMENCIGVLLSNDNENVTVCNRTLNTLLQLKKDTGFWCNCVSLVVSLYLIVCLFVSFSCHRTKAAASILPVKNFPTCPLHCGCQPTNQRHAASRQRGYDANLQTSNSHYWRFPCLSWHDAKQNGAMLQTPTIWLHWLDGHCLVTGWKIISTFAPRNNIMSFFTVPVIPSVGLSAKVSTEKSIISFRRMNNTSAPETHSRIAFLI